MELIQLHENTYYIPNSTNIGVITHNTEAILIDSGLDDAAARKIVQLLEGKGFYIKTIINTHSHADHCGGNAYIKKNSGALVYAPEFEAGIIEYPYLEPLYLFSGANPIKDLKNKFLMANSSQVDYIIKSTDEKLLLSEMEFQTLQLPGHSPNQLGIAINDVLFCADAIFSKEVLLKHKIPFCIDIDKQKETLTLLRNNRYNIYVPSHSEPTNNITDFIDTYFEIIDDVEKYLLKILEQKKGSQEVLKYVCDNYKIEIKSSQQYYLMNTIIMSYLSYLYNNNKIKFQLEQNFLHWVKV